MEDELAEVLSNFGHAGKLGPKNTERLLRVLVEMAQRLEQLERITERLKPC